MHPQMQQGMPRQKDAQRTHNCRERIFTVKKKKRGKTIQMTHRFWRSHLCLS